MDCDSPFAGFGQKLLERGYSIVPIAPGSKYPGAMHGVNWMPMRDWGRYAHRLPTKFEIQIWTTWPDAGIGLVAGPASGHVVGVDIDSDDPIIKSAITSALPPSTFIKRGKKGETRFFRAPGITKSKSWAGICDLIGPGRQTLLPPTIHQLTGKPYVWLARDTLEDTDPASLPELTPEHVAAIDAALVPHGYKAETKALERSPSTFECTDTRGREYALSALRGCGDELAQAQPGTRNNKLNAIAYRLGRMAARLWTDYDEVGEVLWNASCANGSIADDGDRQFVETFNRGYRDGFRNPHPGPRERLPDAQQSLIRPKLSAV